MTWDISFVDGIRIKGVQVRLATDLGIFAVVGYQRVFIPFMYVCDQRPPDLRSGDVVDLVVERRFAHEHGLIAASKGAAAYSPDRPGSTETVEPPRHQGSRKPTALLS